MIRYFHGFAVQKDSEYHDLLNYHIDSLREKGVVTHLFRRNIEPIIKSREIICSELNQVGLFGKKQYSYNINLIITDFLVE